MGQINSSYMPSLPGRILKAKNVGVAVPQAGNTEILLLDVEGLTRVGIQVDVATSLLDGFIVKALMHEDGALQTLKILNTDYTTPDKVFVLAASGDLTAQAAGSTGFLILNVTGMRQIQILVSSGLVGGSEVSAYATGQ